MDIKYYIEDLVSLKWSELKVKIKRNKFKIMNNYKLDQKEKFSDFS